MASSHSAPPSHGGGPPPHGGGPPQGGSGGTPPGGSALVQVKALHAPDILKLPMPTPKDVGAFARPSLPGATGNHTHYLWRGNVAPWTDFEQEVESMGTQSPPRAGKIYSYTNPTAGSNEDPYLAQEFYYCAEEKGLESRFNHHVSHVMSGMAEENGLETRFGDWKVIGVLQQSGLLSPSGGGASGLAGDTFAQLPAEWKKRPDITGFVQQSKELNVLGEVKSTAHYKTQGRTDLKHAGVFPTSATGAALLPLQKQWFGQIGNYLEATKVSYGFVTTYYYTVFVKLELPGTAQPTPPASQQPPKPPASETGTRRSTRIPTSQAPPSGQEQARPVATLKFSEAVPHNAAAGGNTSAGGAGGPTVRECMWYILKMAERHTVPVSQAPHDPPGAKDDGGHTPREGSPAPPGKGPGGSASGPGTARDSFKAAGNEALNNAIGRLNLK